MSITLIQSFRTTHQTPVWPDLEFKAGRPYLCGLSDGQCGGVQRKQPSHRALPGPVHQVQVPRRRPTFHRSLDQIHRSTHLMGSRQVIVISKREEIAERRQQLYQLCRRWSCCRERATKNYPRSPRRRAERKFHWDLVCHRLLLTRPIVLSRFGVKDQLPRSAAFAGKIRLETSLIERDYHVEGGQLDRDT